jgi:hypothetical protein
MTGLQNRKQLRAGMNPDKGTLKTNRLEWSKEVSRQRQEWLKDELARAKAKTDDELGMLAIQMAGRRKIWQIVKNELKEKAFGIE